MKTVSILVAVTVLAGCVGTSARLERLEVRLERQDERLAAIAGRVSAIAGRASPRELEELGRELGAARDETAGALEEARGARQELEDARDGAEVVADGILAHAPKVGALGVLALAAWGTYRRSRRRSASRRARPILENEARGPRVG